MPQIAVQTDPVNRWLRRIDALRPHIGHTPLYAVRRLFKKRGVEVYAKLEWQQFSQSVKARAAFQIIHDALHSGRWREGMHLLDATSGNTGIAYAAIGAAIGLPVTLCLPENASMMRKQILRSLGATIRYTSPLEGTDGAQAEAERLFRRQPDRFYYASQYTNASNWQAHYHHTALEIWEQSQGRITHFVAGLGTTGTFVGCARRFRGLNAGIRCIALHPDTPMHGLEGWKHMETARVPRIYDADLAHAHLEVSSQDALDMMRLASKKEGLLLSPSAAASLVGAIRIAEQITEGVVVTTLADNAEKYPEILKQMDA